VRRNAASHPAAAASSSEVIKMFGSVRAPETMTAAEQARLLRVTAAHDEGNGCRGGLTVRPNVAPEVVPDGPVRAEFEVQSSRGPKA
jgi:hypothetical protein